MKSGEVLGKLVDNKTALYIKHYFKFKMSTNHLKNDTVGSEIKYDSIDSCTTIVRLPAKKSAGSYYILQAEWLADGIALKIFQFPEIDELEWKGKVSKCDLQSTAAKLEFPFDRFYEETKQALGTNNGLSNFYYDLEGNTFVWKKIGKFKELFGSVNLVPTTGLKTELLINSIDLSHKLRENISNLQEQLAAAAKEKGLLADSYSKCIAEKNQLEGSLFSKFALLLNSKKAKIAELKQLLLEKKDVVVPSSSHQPAPIADAISHDAFLMDKEDQHVSDNSNFSQPTQVLPKRRKFEELATIQTTDSLNATNNNAQKSENIENDFIEECSTQNIFERM